MKNKLLCLSIAVLTSAGAVLAQSVEVLIDDEYRLTGALVSMSADQFLLTHAGGKENLKLDPAKISSIIVNERPAVGDDEYVDRIYLTSAAGSSFPCKIVEVTANQVLFKCPFTNQGVINRSEVLGISLDQKAISPLWKGALVFEKNHFFHDRGVFQNMNEKDIDAAIKGLLPKTVKGDMVYTLGGKPAYVARYMNLNVNSFEFNVRLTLPPKDKVKGDKPLVSFIFGANYVGSTIGNEPMRFNILLNVYRNRWEIGQFRHNMFDSPSISGGAEFKSDGDTIDLRLKVNNDRDRMNRQEIINGRRVSGNNIEVLINNEPAMEMTMGIGSGLEQNGFFGLISMGENVVKASRMMASNFNLSPKIDMEPRNGEDVIETSEQETIPGKMLTYSQKKQSISFEFLKQGVPTSIPRHYIDAIVFRKQEENPDLKPMQHDTCSVVMKDGNNWKGISQGIEKGKLKLSHYLLGHMDIPLPLVSRIDFYKQKPPVRSAP